MYRLLAIDLDGTLLSPQRTITPRTYDALFRAAAHGVSLVIATGQTLPVLRAVCADVPLRVPQIIYNGAIVADIATGKILHEHLVPQEYILQGLEAMREAGLHRAYHTHEHVYADRDTPNVRNWYRPPVPPALEVDDVARIYPQPCVKLVGVGRDQRELPALRDRFAERYAGQLYVTQSSRDLVEFLHPSVSKGHALSMIAQDLGIRASEVAAIGDNHNDLGMLRFAGLGIAMGNAYDEVKAGADFVTLSNADDGVAHAIETLILTT